MDGHRFDDLARRVASVRSRRSLLKGAVVGLAAALAGARAGAQTACRRLGRACDAAQPCCDRLVCQDGRCLPGLAACVRPGGACDAGRTCCPGTSCAGGVCCPGPQACGGACCAEATLCRDGVCTSPTNIGCPAGQTRCGAAGCRDLATDAVNCGSCGTACPSGACRGGVCLTPTGSACAAAGECASGACVDGVCCAQASCPSPADGCTEGYCQPGGGQCGTRTKANGAPCDDACTTGGTCQGGLCTGGTRLECSPCQICDGGACVADAGQNGDPCPAGADKCFGAYACQGGACVGVQPKTCSGGPSECTEFTCDPATGLCGQVRDVADDTPCDDDDACTENDTCQGGRCEGTAVVCPPARPCFSALGTCVPDSGECPESYLGDGALCTGGICAGEQCCRVRSGEPYDCDPAFGAVCVTGDGPLCCPLTDGQRCDECYEIYDASGQLDGGLCCPEEQQCGGGCCWFGKVCVGRGSDAERCVEPEQVCAGGVICEGDKCCRASANAAGTGTCCGANEVCAGGACVPYRRPCDQCSADESCVGATFEEDGNGDLVEATPGYCCPFDMIFGTGNDPVPGPIDECCAPRSYGCRGVTCISFDDDFLTCSATSLGFLQPRR